MQDKLHYMNLDLLKDSPFPVLSHNGFTKYELSDRDQHHYCLKRTEWFCDECGNLAEENHLSHCVNCKK